MSLSRRALMRSTASGLAASACAIPTLAAVRQPASPASATPATGNSHLEAALLATMEAHGIPGAIVLLDSPDTGTWSAALGVANLDTGEPMTTDMHMRIGSITKTFTATMVLQLVDQGAFAMDDTLSELLPSQAHLPNAETITLRHLLTMQSGLPDYLGDERVQHADPNAPLTDEEIVALIDGMDAEFSPGERSSYSNTNYILLGMIAREVTGTPWAELVQTNILDEVGLTQTSIPTDATLPSPAPRGYVYDLELLFTGTPSATPDASAAPTDMTLIDPFTSGASGNMISTVADLHTWMGVLQDGTLLSPELQADRLDFSDEGVIESAAGGMAYGLGLINKNGAIGHDGGIHGFRSSMLAWPDTGTTLIVLTNVIPSRDGGDPAQTLMDVILSA